MGVLFQPVRILIADLEGIALLVIVEVDEAVVDVSGGCKLIQASD